MRMHLGLYGHLTPAIPAVAFVVGFSFSGASAQISKNMTEVSRYNPPGVVESSAGIWGYTGGNGKEYALFTSRSPGGLHIIDISAPSAPKLVNSIPSTGNSIWQEVHAYKKVAYKVSQQNSDGLQIIDLSPLDQGRPATLVRAPTTHFKVAHTLYVDTTVTPARLFVAYGEVAGVMIFTLEDPLNPKPVKTMIGRAHDMFARGNRLYVCNQEFSTLTIYDLTDINNPLKLSTIDFNQISPSLGEPRNGISHNAWLSEDNKYLFTTEETRGTSVKAFDITNPRAPSLVGTYIGMKDIIAHNVYVKGNLMFVAHYTAGLRVVDISDPADMAEIAYHKPSTSTDLYGGTWGVYPWFKSGHIIHGDDVHGLFVEKINVLPNSAKHRAANLHHTIVPMEGGRIGLTLARSGPYTLSILSADGRRVLTHPGNGQAGRQVLSLGASLPRGAYLARLVQGGLVADAPIIHR